MRLMLQWSCSLALLAMAGGLRADLLVSSNSVWKYLDDGSDQGMAWTGLLFDDGAWAEGPAELGYGDGNEATTVSFGSDPNNKFITTYFRHVFQVADASQWTNLVVRLRADDGGVVHLNGTEVWRDNMPDGPIAFDTPAAFPIGGTDEEIFEPSGIIDASLLQNGDNILAVEIHQANTTSSDISFDLELEGTLLTPNSPPTVSLTSPPDGAVFTAPAEVNLNASASDPDGQVDRVEFFQGTTLLGEDNTAPFAFAWSGVGPGSYTLVAVAHDNEGAATTSAPMGITVQSFQTGSTNILVATNSTWRFLDIGVAPQSSWVEVIFNDSGWGTGPAQLGYGDGDEATVVSFGSDPNNKHITTFFRHVFNVSNVTQYTSVRVRLLRDDGGVVYLNGTEVFRSNMPAGTVSSDTLASAAVAGPAESQFFTHLVPIDASILREGANVMAVEVHQVSASSSDLSFDLELTGVTETPPVNQPPAVSLTSPQNGASFSSPAELTLLADASDADGSVTRVEFFANGLFLAEDGSSPYQFSWEGVGPGVYAITAVAVDDDNVLTTSEEVTVTVNASGPVTLIPAGAVWKYLDDGTDQGSLWRAADYDDSLWASGPAQLGYGENDEQTVVSFGPDPNDKFITTYFRHAFEVSNPSFFQALRMSVLRDDGVVVYLNDTEVFRDNMPDDPIDHLTLSLQSAPDDGNQWLTNTIHPSLLVAGQNILAAEIHQHSPSSSDISFDLELIGSDEDVINLEPVIQLASPLEGTLFTAPADIRITAATEDPDGLVERVEFFGNGAALGEDVSAPFELTWSGVGVGSYELQAIATDNLGARATSAVVNVSVDISTAPVIASLSPPAGTFIDQLSSVTITFSEPVRGVEAGDLLVNGQPALSVAGGDVSYVFEVSQPRDGTLLLGWRGGADIRDLESPPRLFDIHGVGASWQYFLADGVAPVVASVSPAAGATVTSLETIEVTFSEPVRGVEATDLRVNGLAATDVRGTGAGPYRFDLPQVPSGAATVSWASDHGITDQSLSSNPFLGQGWFYAVDTNAVYEGRVVIHEIMYHPASDLSAEEWVELVNLGTEAVNLTGWEFSRGISFTFPERLLQPGEYLVVAADVPSFQAKHPGVANVVGGWQGRLSNSHEEVELEDAQGHRVDLVAYADEGDYARRELLSGSGLNWFSEADGLGSSLELVNARLENNAGQNWASSAVTEGTPGEPNSMALTDGPPLLLEVAHFPVIPRSTDTITITARVIDEQTQGLEVLLWHRDVTAGAAGAFASLPMADDGASNDGQAGDGVHGAVLPPMPDNSIVEFYIEARDAGSLRRTWPGEVREGTEFQQSANALFQVDDRLPRSNRALFRLVMTPEGRNEFFDQRDRIQRNATFLTVEGDDVKLRYLCDVRRRGASSFRRTPPTLKLNIPADRPWQGKTSMNLNSDHTYNQVIGSVVALKAGLPVANARGVELLFNGVNESETGSSMFGLYAAVEVLNDEWAENHFPNDPNGNVYAKRRPECGFDYEGPTIEAYLACAWTKESNASENDWSDLMNLLFAVDPAFTPDNRYVEAMEANARTDLWLRYFAVLSLMEYSETALASGADDDYNMYRGIEDPRFIILAHDFDTIFGTSGNPGEDIFVAANRIATVNRFLRHPLYGERYFEEFRHQLATTFSTNILFNLLDQHLADWVPATTLDSMKQFVIARNENVRSQLPAAPTTVRATLTGVPPAKTFRNDATLTVGGEDVAAYRFRLNGGAFGPETPVETPIQLQDLPDGIYTVYVIGRNADGIWQEQAEATLSPTWTVITSQRGVVLNEVLARNDTAVEHFGTFPDLVELFNAGSTGADLGGYRLTDNLEAPDKFVIPTGTSLPAGGYLTLWGNNPDGTPGLHLGFGLSQSGEALFLLEPSSRGGRVVDWIEFGLQLPDRAVGRLASGAWGLTVPTLNGPNRTAQTGDGRRLKINEWLANPRPPFIEDFIELYNPDPLPVALGGWHLTDNPIGDPFRHRMTPLSFLEGGAYLALIADGRPGSGVDHVDFRLSQDGGEIALLDENGRIIDCVLYKVQEAGRSEGRSPNGGERLVILDLPTPGAPNPVAPEPVPPQLVNLLPLDESFLWRYEDTGGDQGTAWRATGFDDGDWPQGAGLLAWEPDAPGWDPAMPSGTIDGVPIRTLLDRQPGKITFYFRSRFELDPELASEMSALQMEYFIDDGAILYLNGQEAARIQMPGGDVDFQTLALGGPDASREGPIELPLELLVAGENVVAVEVHQASSGSSDVVFGLELDAVVITNSPSLAGIVLNEVMANNRSFTNADGTITDWAEIHNPSPRSVDLSQMSLTDDLTQPRRWVFPQGSVVAAGGHLAVQFDPARPAATNATGSLNTGFGLAATGDEVYLFDRPSEGGALLDAITFGLQAPDFTLGRIPDGATHWTLAQPSRGRANLEAVLGDVTRVRINEWMADPAGGDDWFEIYNPNAQPVALGGLHLTDDLNQRTKHRIADRSYLASGLRGFQQFRADDNVGAGADHVNFKLSGNGESIGIADATGSLIDAISFGPQTEGVSEGRLPDGTTTIVAFPGTASPGDSNYRLIPDVVINEVLAHSDPPFEDAIELRNLSGSPVDLSGWYLSDAQTFLEKFRIPDATLLPAGGYAVFYESQFNPVPEDPDSFALSSSRGDEVWLSAVDAGGGLNGLRRVVEFGPSANAVSLGRHVTSTTDGNRETFVAMASRTFGADQPESVEEFRTGTGAPNSGPRLGPVVISEIMYHPPDLGGGVDNLTEEFIELQNITGAAVPLYDVLAVTNRWRLAGGIRFEFPSGFAIPAGGFVVVVSFDPVQDTASRAAFETAYNISPGAVSLLGPYDGQLSNRGETVALVRPDPPQTEPGPDFGFVPFVLVEEVSYRDEPPWPTEADGFGFSLTRIDPDAFGDDAGNWRAAAPSPGPQEVPEDSDMDGMPDEWEIRFGFNPNDPGDADQDWDNDGLTNLEEFLAGTDPTDPASVLRLRVAGTQPVTLQFVAEASRSYVVEYQDELDPGGSWETLAVVPPGAAQRSILVEDPSPPSNRFYRIRLR